MEAENRLNYEERYQQTSEYIPLIFKRSHILDTVMNN